MGANNVKMGQLRPCSDRATNGSLNVQSIGGDITEFSQQIPIAVKRVDMTIHNIRRLMTGFTKCEEEDGVMMNNWSTENEFEVGEEFGQLTKWKLILSREELNKDYLSLFLYRQQISSKVSTLYSTDTVIVDIKILAAQFSKKLEKLINSSNETRFSCTHRFEESSTSGGGWTKVIPIKMLLDGKTASTDCLVIKVNFKFMYTKSIAFESKVNMRAQKDKELRLKSKELAFESLKKMLEQEVNATDSSEPNQTPSESIVVLHMTKDHKMLKAHRNILSARSPVFALMFETEMLEKQSGVVKIRQIRSEVMKIVLDYLYTGNLPSIDQEQWNSVWLKYPGEIVNAAEKYGFSILKEFCDQNLISACTENNAVEMLKLARLFHLNSAAEEISEYIKSNYN